MRYLTFALSKGRLAELTMDMLERIGVSCRMDEKSRKLIYVNDEYKLKFLLAKAGDVPTYVEYGAADLGVVGKDTLLEEKRGLYEAVDLRFGECRMAVAGYESHIDTFTKGNNFRVATKYPAITADYFSKRRQTVEIVKLSGSVELAALSGLADLIVDLVGSGATLKENGLVIFEEIADISARLIINRVSLKMEYERVSGLIIKLKGVLKNDSNSPL